MSTHIVMDGAGDLPGDWIKEFDIHVIPINIQYGDKTYLQGVDLSDNDFYKVADRNAMIPKTSQPTPQQFVDFYQRIAKLGDTIISLHVTSKLSGTFSSAVMAARELAGQYNIIPFDSATGSAALGYMCKEARILERAGASVQTIMERLEYIRNNIIVVLTLDTLEYARKSGRVKALQAALASVLQVKPIVVLREGALLMAERVRTRQKSLEFVLETVREQVGDRLVNLAVVHARAPEAAQKLMEQVRAKFRYAELILTDLSIGVAANLGPGTIGIVAYPVEER
jgi:DegV family protein with EDD domain